jgi:hypothetical protein
VNFITVVARVRVIPSSLDLMAERYRAGWETLRARTAPGNAAWW